MPDPRGLSLAAALLAAGLHSGCGAEAPAETAQQRTAPAAAVPDPDPAPPSEPANRRGAKDDWPISFELGRGRPTYQRVVLVTLDTLRRDHVSAYGYARPTTPFLDSLAREGVLFERAIASTSHTAPSHATMLTGLHPIQHGVEENGQRLAKNACDLAGLFGAAGYRTGAFLNVEFLKGVAGSFDTVEVRLNRGAPVVAAMLEWLRTKPRPRRFFAWVHLYDPHRWKSPKRTPEIPLRALRRNAPTTEERLAYLTELHDLHRTQSGDRVILGIDDARGKTETRTPAKYVELVDAYDAQILYADRQLKELVETVGGMDLPGATLWVITSDHGEGLGSHRFSGHGGRIYQEQLAVPLVVHADDGSLARRRVSQLVQHVDLFPTLAEVVHARLIGLDPGLEGHSLWPLLRGEEGWQDRPAFSQRRRERGGKAPGTYALQTPTHKLILHEGADNELYDLAADPLERARLELGTNPEGTALETLLEGRLDSYRTRRASAEAAAVPDEWMEELRALGYVE